MHANSDRNRGGCTCTVLYEKRNPATRVNRRRERKNGRRKKKGGKKEKEKEGEKERKKKLWHLAQLPFLAVPFSETLLVRDFLASSRFTRYLSALTPVERGEIQLWYRVSKRVVVEGIGG